MRITHRPTTKEVHLPISTGKDWVIIYQPWLHQLEPLFPDRPVLGAGSPGELLETLDDAATLLLIGPAAFSNPYDAIAIRQELDVPVGLIPAADVAEAVMRVERCLSRNGPLCQSKDVLLDNTQPGKEAESAWWRSFPEGSVTDREKAHALLSEAVPLLAITAHGRGDNVYLPAYLLLCGRHGGPPLASTCEQRLPACAHTGSCFIQKSQLVNVSQLQPQILFLNSCASISGQTGLFAASYSLDTAILQETTIPHFIGSPLVRYGEYGQAILLSILLHEGLSIGQAVHLVDDTVWFRGLDKQTLLLYGDPSTRFAEPTRGTLLYTESTAAQCEVQSAYAAMFVPHSSTRNRLLMVEGPAPVRALPTRLGYFVFGDAGLVPGTYTWKTVEIDDVKADIEHRLTRPIRRLRQLGILNIHPHKLSGRIADLENRSVQFRHSVKDLLISNAFSEVERKLSQADRAVDQVDHVIMDDLTQRSSRGFHIAEEYQPECRLSSLIETAQECPHCGSPTRSAIWEHHIEHGFARRTTECYRCGYLADQPADSDIQAVLVPDSPIWESDKPLSFELRFTQPPVGHHPLSCLILDTQRFGVDGIIQRTTTDEKTALYRFSLDAPTGLPPHHFWVRAYLVNHGEIHCWSSNVWITPPRR